MFDSVQLTDAELEKAGGAYEESVQQQGGAMTVWGIRAALQRLCVEPPESTLKEMGLDTEIRNAVFDGLESRDVTLRQFIEIVEAGKAAFANKATPTEDEQLLANLFIDKQEILTTVINNTLEKMDVSGSFFTSEFVTREEVSKFLADSQSPSLTRDTFIQSFNSQFTNGIQGDNKLAKKAVSNRLHPKNKLRHFLGLQRMFTRKRIGRTGSISATIDYLPPVCNYYF